MKKFQEGGRDGVESFSNNATNVTVERSEQSWISATV